MPISTGGVLEEGGRPRDALDRLMKLIWGYAGDRHEEDYFVDLAFRSWSPGREPEFLGAKLGPVGRTQRRAIVWHGVPLGLGTDDELREWFCDTLGETVRLILEELPRKSRKYPAESLAGEVEALRAHIRSTVSASEAHS